MNYENKYNEALNRATAAYKDEDRHLKATLERIFPELKEEDEDEKIRRELIQYLKKCTELPDGRYCRDDFFNYLERLDRNVLIKETKRRKAILLEEKETAVSYTENISLGARIAILEELLAFVSEKE